MLYGTRNSNNYNNETLNFLDIISIASFILQLQNRESNMIAEMQNQLSEKIDKQINIKLDKILKDLEDIKSKI